MGRTSRSTDKLRHVSQNQFVWVRLRKSACAERRVIPVLSRLGSLQNCRLEQLGVIPPGVDPKLETLKIETHCSERRFECQVPEFSRWNIELQ